MAGVRVYQANKQGQEPSRQRAREGQLKTHSKSFSRELRGVRKQLDQQAGPESFQG